MLDNNSLLVALGVSAICLMMTLLGTSVARRADSFLLILVVALFFIVIGIFAFSSYTMETGILRASIAYSFLMAGFSTICRFRPIPNRAELVDSGGSSLDDHNRARPTNDVVGFGRGGDHYYERGDGCAPDRAGWQYWRARAEAPGPLELAREICTAGISGVSA